ncbi:glucoside xylosyltransferase 1-like [Eucyclogobius newberryi]|uniref:glucoside xylosyltransferase 1-like n=1 Tax=Eucyclogobius newberryi TaxID=166745 RepID=UPI003B5CAAA0
MRCFRHVLFLCNILTLFSLLYVFSRFSSALEETDRWREQSQAGHRSTDTGLSVRKTRGPGGPHGGLQKCKSVSDWSPYWRLPADVCGVNCLMETSDGDGSSKEPPDVRSHLAVVACGPRLEETLTMLKSALLFSNKPLHFYIFAENALQDSFKNALNSWPLVVRRKFNFTIFPITFPKENEKEWKKLFKPCSSQRLFLPLILQDVDSLLYVDTDILFLQPVEELWTLLSQFNSSQLAAMAPEHEEPRIGWYNRFARHPYYGRTGINSGVMLMNMTRIRAKYFKNDMTTVPLRWGEMLMPLLQKYKLNITWGDQDLLNIIFHHNPESLLVFRCEWNYRPDHCIYGSNCHTADHQGVFILHGNRGVFHDDKQPAFRAVYNAIQKHQFGEDLKFLLEPLEASLRSTTNTYCGRSSHLFTKRLKQSMTGSDL